MTTRHHLLTALLLPLGACVQAPAKPEPWQAPELREGFAAQAADATAGAFIGDAWWESFGDPLLDALVREALERNQDLRAAGARVAMAVAQGRQAGALRGPSVDTAMAASRNRTVYVGLPIPGAGDVLQSTYSIYQGDFNISWEADLWGRLADAERSALASVEVSRAQVAAVRLSIAAQTVRLWFSLTEARLQRELAQATKQSYRETEDFVRARVEVGLAQVLDQRLAESQAARAAADLGRAEQLERSTVRGLEVIIGRYPGGELDGVQALPLLPAPVPVGLPAELLARRPDLVAAQFDLQSKDARGDSQRADLYPKLVLTGSLGRTSDALEHLLDGDFSVWGLAAALSAPLFDGGRREAAIVAIDADLLAARATFAQSVLRACSEVEGALDAETFLAGRTVHQMLALEAARAAEEISKMQYEQGLVDKAHLLEARRGRLQVEREWLQIQHAQLESRVNLLVALGGGFSGNFKGQ